MAETSIEWTSGPNGEEGYTFNPWLGCYKVHAGCTHCYAEVSQAVSMRKGGAVQWGEVWQGGQRVVVADSTWKHPFTWARKAAAAGERRKVFCASLADVLEVPVIPPLNAKPGAFAKVEHVSGVLDAARERLWHIIEDTAWMCGGCGRPCAHSSDTEHRKHRLNDLSMVGAACEGKNGGCLNISIGGLDFLLLTKRPENAPIVPGWVRPLVWLGTSVSDQRTADELEPRLLESKGFRLRLLSVEPLVGPVDQSGFFGGPYVGLPGDVVHDGYNHGVDWVLVGGESGPDARPCNIEWVRDIVRQCREAKVPCFVKQLGSVWAKEHGATTTNEKGEEVRDKKGGDWKNWPADLRVREFPGGAR